jgi:hypothetical protein
MPSHGRATSATAKYQDFRLGHAHPLSVCFDRQQLHANVGSLAVAPSPSVVGGNPTFGSRAGVASKAQEASQRGQGGARSGGGPDTGRTIEPLCGKVLRHLQRPSSRTRETLTTRLSGSGVSASQHRRHPEWPAYDARVSLAIRQGRLAESRALRRKTLQPRWQPCHRV